MIVMPNFRNVWAAVEGSTDTRLTFVELLAQYGDDPKRHYYLVAHNTDGYVTSPISY